MKSSGILDKSGGWTGSVADDEQSKAPVKIGVATGLGALLWLGPYLEVNTVLLPAKVEQVAPGNKAAIVALLAISAMIVATIANIIIGGLSDLTRSRWGRRTPWIVAGSIGGCEPSSLDMPKKRFTWSMFVENFIFPIHDARDFYLALFGKMLINTTTTAIMGYQLYIEHFVRPGAKVLGIVGRSSSMASAYENPDGSIAIAVQNALDRPYDFTFKDPNESPYDFTATLTPRSFNTFLID